MMEELGIQEHMVQVIRSLYANHEAKVRTEYGDMESFSIVKGVRQGCVVSPYIFNLYSEASKTRGTRHRSENGRKKNKQFEICR